MAVVSTFPSYVLKMIQTNYLQRRFLRALRPKTLYRREAAREKTDTKRGQTITETRRGLMDPDLTPMTAGQDPATGDYSIEQFTIFIDRYGRQKPTDLVGSAFAIENKFKEDQTSLAEHAGWTLDRLARNELYMAYSGGDTMVAVSMTGSDTQVQVANLNGFRFVTDADGTPQAVSVSNPLSVTINAVANTVVGVLPDNAKFPNGPGVLFLGTAVNVAARIRVLAVNRPRISLPSGVTSVDGLSGSSLFSFDQILAARAFMQKDRIPKFADGTYHCHLDPLHLKALLQDTAFRQIYQGQPQTEEMRAGVVAKQFGITFFENDDNPNAENITQGTKSTGTSALASFELGCEIQNAAAIPIVRSIMLGNEALREQYVDESEFLKQVDGNVQVGGYQGAFMGDGAFQAVMDGIRYVVRPPQNATMDVITQAYSATLGFAAPSDERSKTSKSRFKRASVMLSA